MGEPATRKADLTLHIEHLDVSCVYPHHAGFLGGLEESIRGGPRGPCELSEFLLRRRGSADVGREERGFVEAQRGGCTEP
jgi:hypothetical protein